jgi:hypothetical protein
MTYAKGLLVTGWCSLLTAMLVVSGCGQTQTKDGRSRRNGSGDLTPKQVENDADANPQKNDGENDDKDQPKKEEPKETPEEKPEEIPLAKIEAAIGLRNYDQINATMSVITGIPSSTRAVRTVFNNLTTSLPTDNDIKGFIGSAQVSVFKLAVEYCDALVKDTTKRADFFPGFNFAGTPAAVLNASGKQDIADTLISKVWGKDLDFLPNHAESVASVVSLIDDILVGKNMNTAAVTPAVVTGACTAVLASAPAVMY